MRWLFMCHSGFSCWLVHSSCPHLLFLHALCIAAACAVLPFACRTVAGTSGHARSQVVSSACLLPHSVWLSSSLRRSSLFSGFSVAVQFSRKGYSSRCTRLEKFSHIFSSTMTPHPVRKVQLPFFNTFATVSFSKKCRQLS